MFLSLYYAFITFIATIKYQFFFNLTFSYYAFGSFIVTPMFTGRPKYIEVETIASTPVAAYCSTLSSFIPPAAIHRICGKSFLITFTRSTNFSGGNLSNCNPSTPALHKGIASSGCSISTTTFFRNFLFLTALL